MKRNIGKFAAKIAAAGVLLGAVAVWADDQQNQQGSTSSADQSQQAGQASSSTSSTSSSDQSATGQTGQSGQSGQFGVGAAGAGSGPIAQIAQDPQQFIKAAYQENLYEVKAGQAAQEKAQNQQTKDFAQSLVQDHQKANDELKKLADQKNVQVSDQLSAPRQRMLDELSGLSGADFDKRFMNQQVRMHRRAIALYQAAAQNNSDSEVKQFAQQNIAGLQHHLQMAQQQGGISEPAGAQGAQGEQEKQGAQGAQEQGQSAQPQSAQPDQSGQSAQPK